MDVDGSNAQIQLHGICGQMHEIEQEWNGYCGGSENAGNSYRYQSQAIRRLERTTVEPCDKEHKKNGHEVGDIGKTKGHGGQNFAVGLHLLGEALIFSLL